MDFDSWLEMVALDLCSLDCDWSTYTLSVSRLIPFLGIRLCMADVV